MSFRLTTSGSSYKSSSSSSSAGLGLGDVEDEDLVRGLPGPLLPRIRADDDVAKEAGPRCLSLNDLLDNLGEEKDLDSSSSSLRHSSSRSSSSSSSSDPDGYRDGDGHRLFGRLRPIKDEWRSLFDKYDPEGFGEIPLEDFEVALDTRDFLQTISPGKLIILQDRALLLRQLGLSAITFQDFVNTLSGKRTLSFKCAMHCRDHDDDDGEIGRISTYNVGGGTWGGRAATPRAGGTRQASSSAVSRSSSVYTIVMDKFMSTVAKETLPDRRDRRYFLDMHRVAVVAPHPKRSPCHWGQEEDPAPPSSSPPPPATEIRAMPGGTRYQCCGCNRRMPPPIFIPTVSAIQVAIQVASGFGLGSSGQAGSSAAAGMAEGNPLVLHPHRQEEAWRYLTYFLVHLDWLHLSVNVLVQLVLGVPLEMVHGWRRIALVYASGVLSGSVAASVFDPAVLLAGCSGGVYALLSGHLANVVLHHQAMERPYLRLVGLLGVASFEIGCGVYRRYSSTSEDWHNLGYTAHLGGIVAGLTIGLAVLKNYEQKLGERTTWWVTVAAMLLVALSVLTFHALRKNPNLTVLCSAPGCPMTSP